MSASTTGPIGFGIVGTGMIAGFHAQAIQRTPGARLVGFAGRTARWNQFRSGGAIVDRSCQPDGMGP